MRTFTRLIAALFAAGLALPVLVGPVAAASPTFTISANDPAYDGSAFTRSVTIQMRAGFDDVAPFDYQLSWSGGSWESLDTESTFLRPTIETPCDGTALTVSYSFTAQETSASGTLELTPCWRLPLSASINAGTLTAQIAHDGAPLEDGAACRYLLFYGTSVTDDNETVRPVMDGSFGYIEAVGFSSGGSCPDWQVSLPRTMGTQYMLFGAVESNSGAGFLMDTNPVVMSAPATASGPNVSPDIGAASLPTLWISHNAQGGAVPTTYTANVTGGSLPASLTYSWTAMDYADPNTPYCDAPVSPTCVQASSEDGDTFAYSPRHDGGIAVVFLTIFTDDPLIYLNAGVDPKVGGVSPTRALILVDESGSMIPSVAAVRRAYNATLRNSPGSMRADLRFFSKCRAPLVASNRISRLPSLTEAGYQPRKHCWSPIYDRVAAAIKAAAKAHPGEALAVTIITDGRDNASRDWSLKRLRALIARKMNVGWTFSYPMARV